MPAAQATITTGRAATYLARLCGHAGKMSTAAGRLHPRPRAHGGGAPPGIRQVRQDGDQATVILDRGQWTMRAEPGQLVIRAEAAGADDLARIQELVAARLRTLARREQITIDWHPA